MFSLAIECSSKVASVTIANDSNILRTLSSSNPKTHSEFLNSAIESLLNSTNLSMNKLSRVCVSTGPGSFTGIRVGIGIAKTMSFSLRLPIYAVDSLSLLAEIESEADGIVVPVINAQKNLIFWSAFQSKSPLNPEKIELMSPRCSPTLDLINYLVKQTKVVRIVGEGASLVQNQLLESTKKDSFEISKTNSFPSSEVLSQVGIHWAKNVQPIDWNLIQPLYIRDSEAEENLRNKV